MPKSPSRKSPGADAINEPPAALVQCKNMDCNLFDCRYLRLQILKSAIRPGVIEDANQAVRQAPTSIQEIDIMTEHSLWRLSRALHRAVNERQRDDLEALIDDDVDWAIYGPIDM